MERLFVGRLRELQPTQAYLRLFNAIVLDVWKEHRTSLRDASDQVQFRLRAAEQRLESLERAFIFERRIDRTTYETQRDKCREELTLLEIELPETRLEELDVEGLLAFSEEYLTDAARLWFDAPPEQKSQMQGVFFPEGISFDGQTFGTATTYLAFRKLPQISQPKEAVASPRRKADPYPCERLRVRLPRAA